MAEALKVNGEGVRGGSNGGNGGSLGGGLGAIIEAISAYPKRLQNYVHEVRVEMKQVNWPSRPEVMSTTVVVVVTVAFFALFFALTDTILTRAANWVFHLAAH
jgi:preprotein translocase subunit SecE